MSCFSLGGTVSVCDLLIALAVLLDDLVLHVDKADLDCFITIILLGLDLGYYAGSGLKYGNGDKLTVICKDLSHSDLCCKYCLFHFLFLS